MRPRLSDVNGPYLHLSEQSENQNQIVNLVWIVFQISKHCWTIKVDYSSIHFVKKNWLKSFF